MVRRVPFDQAARVQWDISRIPPDPMTPIRDGTAHAQVDPREFARVLANIRVEPVTPHTPTPQMVVVFCLSFYFLAKCTLNLEGF